MLEAARSLSQRSFDATIVYAVFSGEEQGLWGAELLADTAKARGWQVSAMLNNDIVGNTVGQGGVRVADKVRVFLGRHSRVGGSGRATGPPCGGRRGRWPQPRAGQGDR